VDTTRPQRKRTTKEYLEKRSGERNVDRQQDTSTAGGEDGGGRNRADEIYALVIAMSSVMA